MADRVVVFIDYENMHRGAAERFGEPNGHFWPSRLGELLVARRNARPTAQLSILHQVRVYRGLPDARLQAQANAAHQAQSRAWRVAATRPTDLVAYNRPLRYPPRWPNGLGAPQEKGVDVALAVDLVQMAYQGAMNVGIVCSHDSDLAPALDVVRTVHAAPVHLEVACWAGRRRITYSNESTLPWCHNLSRDDFQAVRDLARYP